MTHETKTILIVEDSDDDFEFTERALRKSNLKNPIKRCIDGQSALDYLYQKESYNEDNAPRPGIILLDLNMPGLDGRHVLEKIKSEEHLKNIPAIVLTTSSNERDIEECYSFGANAYIQKPVDIDNFLDAIKKLKDFWFEIVILPKE